MEGVVLAAELVVATCLLAIVSFLVVTYLRRRVLSRDGEVIVCSLHGMGADRWRPGLLGRTDVFLEWYPMFGLTTSPSHRWDRHSLRLGDLDRAEAANDAKTDRANAGLFTGDPVLVHVEVRGVDGRPLVGQLALAAGPYTAVRAWVEAAPPGNSLGIGQV